MYSREFEEPPQALVQNGKAVFGTFSDISPKLDIKGMRSPYAGLPLPSFISNLRIKSRLDFVFSLDKTVGIVEFFDFKIFGLVELILWNKESGKKYAYHSFTGPRRRFVPIITKRGICASYSSSRFVKVSWGRMHQHHALSFKVKGDSVRPAAEGYVYSPMKDSLHTDSLFVSPSPSSSRCSASWFVPMNISGHITVDGVFADDSAGIALMFMNRSYYKLHSKTVMAWGFGTVKEKQIAFELRTSNMDAADSDRYNDNILVTDGIATALPSVVITHPFGIDKKWIIQDTESMVDLAFNPISVNSRLLNMIALRFFGNVLYGTFEGVLLDKNGDKIVLKNFPGIINRNQIRL